METARVRERGPEGSPGRRRTKRASLPAAIALGVLAVLGAARSPAGEDRAEGLARALVAATGTRAGLCVCLGATDGRLEAALGANGGLLVQSLASGRAAGRSRSARAAKPTSAPSWPRAASRLRSPSGPGAC